MLDPRRIETNREADLEQLLERVDEAVYQPLNGGGRQTAACQFVIYLRRQGFLPTQRFARQFLERVRPRGPQFDPKMFGNEFYRARHYQRPGYFARIAEVQGVPVLYRMAGEGGNLIALVGVLREGASPHLTPAPPPPQGKVEAMFGRPRRPPGAGTTRVGGSRSLQRDLTREQMATFLRGIWDRNPILHRLASTQTMTEQARRHALIQMLEEFQRQTRITVQVVPQGTVQAARGAGNLASLRSRPGFLQMEGQLFQNTDALMKEVRHELAYHYAGGPDGVPRLRDSPFNAMNLLEWMIQGHGRLPPSVT